MTRAVLGLLLLSAGAAWAADDPLLRPVEPERAHRWLADEAPVRVFGNTYLVGFGGLNVALIRTDAGLILIDAAVPQAVPLIERNIRALGFRLDEVRFILSTEPHYDHAGGLAALVRSTGATVVASAAAAGVLRAGRSGPDDPQWADLPAFPPVPAVRVIADGERLQLGDVVVTARATPGHTPGSLSWTWRACEDARCAEVVFAASLSPLAAGDYRFSAPERRDALAGFRRSFETLRHLPCDLLLTPHHEQSGGREKLAALRRTRDPHPFLGAGACRDYADRFERLLDARLATEAAPAAPHAASVPDVGAAHSRGRPRSPAGGDRRPEALTVRAP